MTDHPTRDAIVGAARQLFGERGYTSTTIKDVAELAGFSPAMVMKVMGSKAQLYAVAAPTIGPDDEQAAVGETIGHQLVRNVITRRDEGVQEPWAMAPLLIHEAPDQDAARAQARQRYVDGVAQRIGDTSPGQHRAEVVVCLLLGLASGLRSFGLLAPDTVDGDLLVAEYGDLVQSVLERDETT